MESYHVYGICRTVIGFLSIIFNIIMFVVLIKKRKEKCPIRHLMMSLCIADIFAAVTTLTYAFSVNFQLFTLNAKTFYFFAVYLNFNVISIKVSIFLHTIALAIYRFVVVSFPLHHSRYISRKSKGLQLLVIWTFSSISGAASIVYMVLIRERKITDQSDIFEKMYGLIHIISSIIVFIIYSCLIVVLIVNKRKSKKTLGSTGGKTLNKATYMCLAIALAFLICHLPLGIGFLEESLMFFIVFDPMSSLMSLINPILYLIQAYC